MNERPAFQVGESDSDHLRIVVLDHQSSDQHGSERGMLACQIEVSAAGVCAEYRASLPAQSFAKLRDDLAKLDHAFGPGFVQFDPGYEPSIAFEVRVGNTGQIEVAGVAIDGLGSGWEQELRFRFLVRDSLRVVLASARATADFLPAQTH